MDTDNLSNEAYKAVIVTAEVFNHDLTLHFGCLAMKRNIFLKFNTISIK